MTNQGDTGTREAAPCNHGEIEARPGIGARCWKCGAWARFAALAPSTSPEAATSREATTERCPNQECTSDQYWVRYHGCRDPWHIDATPETGLREAALALREALLEGTPDWTDALDAMSDILDAARLASPSEGSETDG